MAYLGNVPARSFISFERQVFTIVNSQTAYTLSHSVTNENDIRLVVNNVVQEPGSGKAYTATGTTLTLSAALTNGTDEMYCVFLGRATATNAPGAGSVGTSQIADDAVTTAKIVDDAVTNAKVNDDLISGATALTSEPADTDEFLVSDAGTLKRIDYSLIKGGGITNAQQWRITAAQNNMDNGDHITNNWEQVDSYGYGGIGSAMSQSSGIFTFPATGIWYISFTCNGSDNNSQRYIGGQITSTTDNSNYNIAVQGNSNISSSDQYFTNTINFIFDVTNTTTHKIRFAIHCQNNGIDLTGNTNRTDTGAVFIRLGDT